MEFWQIIATLFTLFAILTNYVDSNNDFVTSVNPILVDIDQGGIAQVSAEVRPESFYDEDIILRAESVPSYIHVNFEPQVLKHENNSASTIIISAETDAPPGEQWISIIGTGSDGKEHNCTIKLIITPVTSTEGFISVYSSPAGACIYLDGKYEGEAPTVLKNIGRGSHIINLNLTGYEDWTQIINVESGQTFWVNSTLTPISKPVASAEIEKVWAEYDVWENNLLGMRIHAMFNTHNLSDENCKISTYFYCTECGERLTDSNQSYCDPDGNVVSYTFFTPTDIDANFRDFSIFMPYNEIHLQEGESYLATHSDKLKFNVVISREEEILAFSDWGYFDFTQA